MTRTCSVCGRQSNKALGDLKRLGWTVTPIDRDNELFRCATCNGVTLDGQVSPGLKCETFNKAGRCRDAAVGACALAECRSRYCLRHGCRGARATYCSETCRRVAEEGAES